jgi:murein DD-endopeptidase MepM/ murein hydrolase activator NlpD
MLFKKFKITSKFGPRILENGDSSYHHGVDFVGVGDITVLSPVSGKVVSSQMITDRGNITWQWGNYVAIESPDKHKHYFCHLSSRLVKVGTIVKVGQPIGIMGNTGYSFGSHLHYGIRNTSNVWINPLVYHDIASLKVGTIYNMEVIMDELLKQVKELAEKVATLEQENKRYKKIDEFDKFYQDEIQKAVDRGIIKGNTDGTIDMTKDMVRNMIIAMRIQDNPLWK